MKKQLLIAAVAATMGTAAIADISITGDAKYEYTYTDTSGTTATNAATTEVNLKMKGTHGDTTVVLNQEFAEGNGDTANSGDTSGENHDIEDMWVSTKVGPVNLKFGNWTTGLSSNTGEILQNSRSGNKAYATTKVGDFTLGYYTVPGNGGSDGVTISGTIAGVNVGIKESPNSFTDINISGEIAGVNYRFDNYDSDTVARDAQLAILSTEQAGVTLGLAHMHADSAASFTEDDGIWEAYEDDTVTTEVTQLTASMPVAGNTVTVGYVKGTEDDGTENDAAKIIVTRSLAGGMNLKATYADLDNPNATTTSEVTTVKLSVAF